MKVSVVICVYSTDLYPDFCDAVRSVLGQSYPDIEVVAVIDGNDKLCTRIREKWGSHEDVIIHCNEQNRGLSASRNVGIKRATGDIIAFLDDDAVADERWVEELVGTYKQEDVEAVGGKMTPIWPKTRPDFLPEEFFWLVGVTHRGFPDEGPVRNTFGSNISFRSEVFEQIGGFNEELGRKGDKHVQGEETELAERMRQEIDGTLYYNPNAEVGHKIFTYRTDPIWLLSRAFWQGYSKYAMSRILPQSEKKEVSFLADLLVRYLPDRVYQILRSQDTTQIKQVGSLLLLTTAVGVGYVYAMIKYIYSDFR
ncbi:glycosyltransferase [Salinarchaeum sp. IM2453]|uniref:glycosyltransferase n=1 Tax=Salinarchaeum sp. IM2453 TaxID=2862870 RepID=UPI001C83084B|nr:glycosyltransferase [Salinarchaeum sp. IM2453]QZA87975.1 glycosyltransferase [Salinarchaeum sp. IM2453]